MKLQAALNQLAQVHAGLVRLGRPRERQQVLHDLGGSARLAVSEPPLTVDDVAAPYVNFLVRVPAAGPGVCQVCHSIVSSTYALCFACNDASWTLGASRAEAAMDRCGAVAPGTSPVRSQLRSARSVAATQADSARVSGAARPGAA